MTVGADAREGRIEWGPLLVFFVFVLLSVRQLVMIEQYSVNVLFWDQWDFMEPVMRGAGPWELFRSQHGPHRQGIAFLLTTGLAGLSDWSSRVDAISIGLMVCVATAGALWLQARLRGRLGWSDVVIPLVVLTPAQYGVFLHTPNASHGAAPSLLLIGYCLALTIGRRGPRYGALLALNFLLIHTGFGLFVGALTPLYFIAEALASSRSDETQAVRWAVLGLILSLASAGLFFVGYVFDAAVGEFSLGPEQLLASPRFIALMFANVLGLKGVGGLPTFVGGLLAAVALAIAARHAVALVLGHESGGARVRSQVICVLILFSLLFCLNAALGRVALGLPGAQSSRYVPLVVPAVLGVYLQALAWSDTLSPWRSVVLRAALIAGLVAATFPMRASEYDFMRSLSARKAKWVETYVATHDMDAADRAARLKIYPWPEARADVQTKLDWLEARQLNLFDRSE